MYYMEPQVKYGLIASSIIAFSLLGYGYYLQNYTVKDNDSNVDDNDKDGDKKKIYFKANKSD